MASDVLKRTRFRHHSIRGCPKFPVLCSQRHSIRSWNDSDHTIMTSRPCLRKERASRQSKHEGPWRQIPLIKAAASSTPSSSASRIAHSHQMASLSMNTFGTASQLDRPSELQLPGGAAPHTALAATPTSWHFVVGLPSGFVSISDLLSRPRERGYWEHMRGACGDGDYSPVYSCQSKARCPRLAHGCELTLPPRSRATYTTVRLCSLSWQCPSTGRALS
ncbi:hypothetical protein BC826DRAFT_50525 [Russula brevipes]|nr:hypothetical protein BC826DRAFT_50525 [Russula brevipes]